MSPAGVCKHSTSFEKNNIAKSAVRCVALILRGATGTPLCLYSPLINDLSNPCFKALSLFADGSQCAFQLLW